MTDEEHLDAALLAVYLHHLHTSHSLRFHASGSVLEYVCPECGTVLYEGPEFEDPIPGFSTWRCPTRPLAWVRRMQKRVMRARGH